MSGEGQIRVGRRRRRTRTSDREDAKYVERRGAQKGQTDRQREGNGAKRPSEGAAAAIVFASTVSDVLGRFLR